MNKINKTNNYDQFILISDNREKIDNHHVERLIKSIQSRNLLALRPIIVNDKMEVIDGQHRLQAARALKVEIYYQIEETLNHHDIILMNIAKTWVMADYLNYYVKNAFIEYQHIQKFMNENNISLNVAINLQGCNNKKGYEDFRNGRFKFQEEQMQGEIAICWKIINQIKRMNGPSRYTNTTKFWHSLLKIIRNEEFEIDWFMENLKKMPDACGIRINGIDYCKMFMKIYNYKRLNKIVIVE